MGNAILTKMRFYTKDANELIKYKIKGASIRLPVIFFYEHPGPKKEALKAFMPFDSFIMGETDDTFVAFPLKGYPKIGRLLDKKLVRVEKGNVTSLDKACSLCKDRIKKALKGCEHCQGLKGLPQLYPMTIRDIKGKVDFVAHGENGRRRVYQPKDRSENIIPFIEPDKEITAEAAINVVKEKI